MRTKINFLLFLIISITLLFACDKPDDLSKLKLNYTYKAKFSLPVLDTLSIIIEQNALNLPQYYDSIPDSLNKLLKIPKIYYQKSFPFNLSSIIDTTGTFPISRLMFRFDIKNNFPQIGHFSLYLRDINEFIIDSLDINKVFPYAIIINDSTTAQTDTIENLEPIDSTRLKGLISVNDILISGYLNNDTSITRKFYKQYHNYRIFFSVGIQIDFNYKN